LLGRGKTASVSRSLQALGGKSQVQLYAQQSSGDPIPVFEVVDGQSRFRNVILPGSVIGTEAKVQASAIGATNVNTVYDSGWIDILSWTLTTDARNYFIDISVTTGVLTVVLTHSGLAEFRAYVRMLKDVTTSEWPAPGWDASSAPGFPYAGGFTGPVNSDVMIGDAFRWWEPTPTPGVHTYTWQIRVTFGNILATPSSTNSWSLSGFRGRLLTPRNQL
jgi:hypothetical protein